MITLQLQTFPLIGRALQLFPSKTAKYVSYIIGYFLSIVKNRDIFTKKYEKTPSSCTVISLMIGSKGMVNRLAESSGQKGTTEIGSKERENCSNTNKVKKCKA